ncbi:MAG: hypothetical protein MK180_17435 [Rhodobacteraceae bacterium]|nr:hypothetical protein [Paracoccaceae bacterium]
MKRRDFIKCTSALTAGHSIRHAIPLSALLTVLNASSTRAWEGLHFTAEKSITAKRRIRAVLSASANAKLLSHSGDPEAEFKKLALTFYRFAAWKGGNATPDLSDIGLVEFYNGEGLPQYLAGSSEKENGRSNRMLELADDFFYLVPAYGTVGLGLLTVAGAPLAVAGAITVGIGVSMLGYYATHNILPDILDDLEPTTADAGRVENGANGLFFLIEMEASDNPSELDQFFQSNPDVQIPYAREIADSTSIIGDTAVITPSEADELSDTPDQDRAQEIYSSVQQRLLHEIDQRAQAIDDRLDELQTLSDDQARVRGLQATIQKLERDSREIQGAIQVTSFIVGAFWGPKVGNQIATIANAAHRVWFAAKQYSLGVIGGWAMAGTAVGAFSAIAALSQRSNQQMVLSSLRMMSEQIANVRKEMHLRFDRLEQILGSLSETLQNALGRIAANQQYQIFLIQQSELILRNFRSTYVAQEREAAIGALLVAVDTFEAYAASSTPLSETQFIDILVRARNHANRVARQPIFNSFVEDIAGEDLWRRVEESGTFDSVFGLVGGIAQDLGVEGVPSDLPNPTEWARGATIATGAELLGRTYANPTFPRMLKSLAADGEQIVSALTKLGDSGILLRVLQNMQVHSNELIEAIDQRIRDTVQNEWKIGDPFTYSVPDYGLYRGSNADSWIVPNVNNQISNNPFLIAQSIGFIEFVEVPSPLDVPPDLDNIVPKSNKGTDKNGGTKLVPKSLTLPGFWEENRYFRVKIIKGRAKGNFIGDAYDYFAVLRNGWTNRGPFRTRGWLRFDPDNPGIFRGGADATRFAYLYNQMRADISDYQRWLVQAGIKEHIENEIGHEKFPQFAAEYRRFRFLATLRSWTRSFDADQPDNVIIDDGYKIGPYNMFRFAADYLHEELGVIGERDLDETIRLLKLEVSGEIKNRFIYVLAAVENEEAYTPPTFVTDMTNVLNSRSLS